MLTNIQELNRFQLVRTGSNQSELVPVQSSMKTQLHPSRVGEEIHLDVTKTLHRRRTRSKEWEIKEKHQRVV